MRDVIAGACACGDQSVWLLVPLEGGIPAFQWVCDEHVEDVLKLEAGPNGERWAPWRLVPAGTEYERLAILRRFEVGKVQGRDPWFPWEHQVVPGGDEWYLWLLLAGRGAGKTDACANYFDGFMRTFEKARGGIVGPTIGDVAEACVYGPSGLLAHNPNLKVRQRAGGTHVVWPNGSEARLFGTHTRDDVERLRAGGNRHLYWAEEVAAWRYLAESWENMELGLRLGKRPHVIGSTTPKPRPHLKKLMGQPDTFMSTATTFDNPLLPRRQLDRLLAKYKGTRIGKQELEGIYLEDVEGALWTYETIAKHRVRPEDAPESYARVVVGVDPSGSDSEGNDEQGIVVVGRGLDGHAYVFADISMRGSPSQWGRACVVAYDDYKADRIACETNFGGDMVLSTIKVAAKAEGLTVNTKKLTASRGKVVRAEPVSALYEQGLVHHVGEFEELELQQRMWTPDSKWSPDRMDALVWAISELQLGGREVKPMQILQPNGVIPNVDRAREASTSFM